tara:strand:+ start:1197 stop:1670 length:474 start_codon:yes stop_codon:yes gene_type:complete
MSWRDVLKDFKQVSRSVGGLDWDKETIPDNEDEGCIKKLKEYYNKAKNHTHSITDSHWEGDISEEAACEAVKRIESIKYNQEDNFQGNWKGKVHDDYFINMIFEASTDFIGRVINSLLLTVISKGRIPRCFITFGSLVEYPHDTPKEELKSEEVDWR